MTLQASFLETQQLTVRFGNFRALQDISLAMPSGQIFAILGPSGSGKTSFLCALNRLSDLDRTCVVSGEVLVQGISIKRFDVTLLRRKIGKIFQKPNPFPMSIRKNFSLPLKEHGVRSKVELENRMEAALTQVGLWTEVADRLELNAQHLSGGQQQRLCIARALALEPDALLLDEPCSSLDPMATSLIENLLQELRGRYTLIIVTHNLAQARRLADSAALFWNEGGGGRLVETGTARELFENPSDPRTQSYIQEGNSVSI